MTTGRITEAVRQLRRAAGLRDAAELTDGQLLEDFLSRRDETAMEALVRRHGPMVWGVCRRVLSNHHDAEDAFQAAFLVLVRKADSIRPRERVADWLYGVARQTALKARATAARRKGRERQVDQMPEPRAARPAEQPDWEPLLDQELSRLPAKYRVLVVLCDLEGKSRKEAARQLGCPEGTVGGRLARARRMLAERLARRGLAVSSAALAASLAQAAASAAVPTPSTSAAVRSVALWASGRASGLVSVKVAALTDGVLNAMLIQKLKAMAAMVLAALLAVGGVLVSCTAPGAAEAASQARHETKASTAAIDDGKADPDKEPPKAPPLTLDEVTGRMLLELGNRFEVEVTGRTKGLVSGSDLYFCDSNLEAAAVHAGLVKDGEKAVITVTVVKCPPTGYGSTRYGVKSHPWSVGTKGTALLLERLDAKSPTSSDDRLDPKKLEERIERLRKDLAEAEAELKALKAKSGK
jgi:RNA polymerase sigma factor (sigma-70 family)